MCLCFRMDTFFPDYYPRAQPHVQLVVLKPGQIIFIPRTCLHYVETPKTSLVFAGNFIRLADLDRILTTYDHEIKTTLELEVFPNLPGTVGVAVNELSKPSIGTLNSFIKTEEAANRLWFWLCYWKCTPSLLPGRQAAKWAECRRIWKINLNVILKHLLLKFPNLEREPELPERGYHLEQ